MQGRVSEEAIFISVVRIGESWKVNNKSY